MSASTGIKNQCRLTQVTLIWSTGPSVRSTRSLHCAEAVMAHAEQAMGYAPPATPPSRARRLALAAQGCVDRVSASGGPAGRAFRGENGVSCGLRMSGDRGLRLSRRGAVQQDHRWWSTDAG